MIKRICWKVKKSVLFPLLKWPKANNSGGEGYPEFPYNSLSLSLSPPPLTLSTPHNPPPLFFTILILTLDSTGNAESFWLWIGSSLSWNLTVSFLNVISLINSFYITLCWFSMSEVTISMIKNSRTVYVIGNIERRSQTLPPPPRHNNQQTTNWRFLKPFRIMF